jgi:hypothetical protein
MKSVLVTILTLLALLVLYRFVFNPQVVLGYGTGTICPDGWAYSDGLCHPGPTSSCTAFDPTTMRSAVQACNLARMCGNSWPGKCP